MFNSPAVAKAVAAEPQATTTLPAVPGRVLFSDGDALAYTCAGNEECSPGQARINLMNTLGAAKRASGAETHRLLLTARHSHKGYRYATATVKEYQGQRSSGRRPKNWEYLRRILEQEPPLSSDLTSDAEADDLFGKYSTMLGWKNVVIHTQDKDMRMVPGLHLTWDTMRLIEVPPETWELVFNDLVYGRKWFWLQMLMGDNADFVPGLPKYVKPNGKEGLCGEATAMKLLAECQNNEHAFMVVGGLYKGYYGDAWDVQLLEQAVLLWMRNDERSRVFNVLDDGNPLGHVRELFGNAQAIITQRIKSAVL